MGRATPTEAETDRVLDLMGRGGRRRCILCGEPAVYACVWMPFDEEQHRLLTAPGKRTTVGYAMCQACGHRTGAAEQAQSAVLEDVRRKALSGATN